MYYCKRIATIVCVTALALLSLGCSTAALYPASDIQVTEVSPYHLIPTGTALSDIGEVSVKLKLLSGTACNLVSYDINYETCLGDSLESLKISDFKVNLSLEEKDSEVSAIIRPYTMQLMDLYRNTTSNISPVKATILLHFEDVNSNKITKSANLLLYKYD